MNKIMKRDDIVDELYERTGFYKKNIRVMLDALEDIVMDNMKMATLDENTELKLFVGIKLGSKMREEKKVINPRTGERFVSPPKILPYCKFERNVREKINANEDE